MSHTFSNEEISYLLKELAAVLEALGDNVFKIRAYKNAAETVEFLDEPLVSVWERGDLKKVKGIGKAIAEKLGDVFEHGQSDEVEQIKARVPAAMFTLFPFEGLGPKKAYRLTQEFSLTDPETVFEDIKKLAVEDAIASLDGFGKKSQDVIVKAIERYNPENETRMRIDQADAIADEIIEYLRTSKAVIKISALGSLRRRKSTIGDVDLGVATNKPEEVIAHVESYPGISEVLVSGDELIRFIHKSGQNVDVKVLNPDMWGTLIQHFSGSKNHNVALRERALKKGWSLSEHGVKFVGEKKQDTGEKQDQYDALFSDEKKFYKYMDLDWVPPELREDRGEIEIAESHMLPTLVNLDDIKGDFHTHTNYDWKTSHDYGTATPEALIKAAIDRGYDYIGVGDHNPSTHAYSDKEITKIVQNRVQKIFSIASKYQRVIEVFNTLEVDIKSNGELALPEDACHELDLVIVSVHSSMQQDKKTMTKRILKALEYPNVKIIGHPTGKLINKREGYELEWKEVFAVCKEKNIALEINANPNRLDLNETIVRQAIEAGVKLVINTDAHDLAHLDYMKYGVDVARRGWAEKKDIVNTMAPKEIENWIRP